MGILPESNAGKLCIFCAAYYSFFATGLMISPNFFFGPDTPLVITSHFVEPFSTQTVLFARFFAGTALSTLWAPWLVGIDYGKWVKILLINNIFVTLIYTWGLFIQPVPFYGSAFLPKMMWFSEYALGFALLAINVMVLGPKQSGEMF